MIVRALVSLVAALAPAQAERPAEAARPAAVIPVHGEIDSLLLESIERRVEQAKAAGATLLVFDFDTPGGELRAMLDIGDLVFSLEEPVRAIAYVSREALSAGAFIAFACREIVMAPSAIIGDCEPIFMNQTGGIETAEKFQSPIRAEFRKFAERHGYPSALVEAMVTKEAEVFEVRLRDANEPIYAEAAELETWPDDLKAKIVPGSKRVVVKKGQLLTMHASEALEYGISKRTVKDLAEVLAMYGADPAAPTLSPTWSEDVAAFLQTPALRFLLLLVGLLGLYMEFKTPGFGVFGIVGTVALLLLFGSSYVAGLAEFWEILVFCGGVALLLVEIFVLPGFGVAGILGLLLVFLALYLSALPFVIPDTSSPLRHQIEVEMVKSWILQIGAGVLSFFAVAAILAKLLPRMPGASRLILAPETSSGAALHGSAAPEPARGAIPKGAAGVALTPLRPSGAARIAGARLDVVTNGDFIEAGERVVVVAAEATRTVVAREKAS